MHHTSRCAANRASLAGHMAPKKCHVVPPWIVLWSPEALVQKILIPLQAELDRVMGRPDMCYLMASVAVPGLARCNQMHGLRIDVHQHKLMPAVLRRPFGSRVAETLLKRLEALIEEAADEDALLLMQQVIAMVPLPSPGKA